MLAFGHLREFGMCRWPHTAPTQSVHHGFDVVGMSGCDGGRLSAEGKIACECRVAEALCFGMKEEERRIELEELLYPFYGTVQYHSRK